MHIILETPRLLLRRFTEADTALLLALNSDPEVLKYIHEPALEDEAHALRVIKEIILPQYEDNLGRWAMHKKDDGVFIGWCGLKKIAETGEIDLGYRLMKIYWGQGYATEAARHCLHYGFTVLGLPLITAHAHIENGASLHILKKIGLQFIKEQVLDGEPVKTFNLANPAASE